MPRAVSRQKFKFESASDYKKKRSEAGLLNIQVGLKQDNKVRPNSNNESYKFGHTAAKLENLFNKLASEDRGGFVDRLSLA